MKITLEQLIKMPNGKTACQPAIDWFVSKSETDFDKLYQMAIDENHHSWISWYVVQMMNHKQKVHYAIFAAEQVVDIFEKERPGDNRPRDAIKAAKKWTENPTSKNAADAASSAADAADAAHAAAYYAAAAAYYAAAAYAAYAAEDAAYYAAEADAAAVSAYAAAVRKELKVKILEYGVSLLKS